MIHISSGSFELSIIASPKGPLSEYSGPSPDTKLVNRNLGSPGSALSHSRNLVYPLLEICNMGMANDRI